MLKRVRTVLALVFFLGITLLLLDFTGALHAWLGWMAKVQLLPAVMALNVGVIAGLILLTLLFGRVYCSVICPMGVFQDIISRIHVDARRRRKVRKYFSWRPERKWIRYGVWAVFVIALLLGVQAFVALLAPYSAYGRIVQNLFQPVCLWGNNLLTSLSERVGSYAFYSRAVWVRSLPTLLIAAATLVVIFLFAWTGGRTYCNTICPVGTTLGFFSRFALFRPVLDADKCRTCHACERVCKSSCIDLHAHKIDYSRCVDCFNCIGSCKFDAMKYRWAYGRKAAPASPAREDKGLSRRAFLTTSALFGAAATLGAQQKKVDGGYAALLDKEAPRRDHPLTPFGSRSTDDFYRRCTACQLCVAECPNDILRPSASLEHLMQPEMSYERGWCRVECVRCSEVCPSGAIRRISPEEKTRIHIGTASVDRSLCVVETHGVKCGNCARHCPAGAIRMVRKDPDSDLLVPTILRERCIGCGACENLCPSRPISAIRVNGLAQHVIDS